MPITQMRVEYELFTEYENRVKGNALTDTQDVVAFGYRSMPKIRSGKAILLHKSRGLLLQLLLLVVITIFRPSQERSIAFKIVLSITY